VLLPGPKVDAAEASIDPDSLVLVKPGMAFQLEVDAGEHTDRIRKAMEEKFSANNWQISDDSPYKVSAVMKHADAMTVQMVVPSPDGRAQLQTTTFRPYYAVITITRKETHLWQTGTGSGVPPVFSFKTLEEANAKIEQWQTMDPGFFERVAVPAKIKDPLKLDGLGMTQVTNRGLIADGR
jgi:hypothetical protein